MQEIIKRSYEEIFKQKRSELADLVKQYGGIMIGHPDESDISSLAAFKARIEMGDKLSKVEQKQAKKIAHKFKGSFC